VCLLLLLLTIALKTSSLFTVINIKTHSLILFMPYFSYCYAGIVDVLSNVNFPTVSSSDEGFIRAFKLCVPHASGSTDHILV